MAIALVLLLLVAGLILAVYLHDTRQTQHTILRNFPVLGHFRYFSENFGEYMRQYQYLPDWVERPFNRLERAWIYRTAKGVSNLVSFGSSTAPSFAFLPTAFPVLDEEHTDWQPRRIGVSEGPGACREPNCWEPVSIVGSRAQDGRIGVCAPAGCAGCGPSWAGPPAGRAPPLGWKPPRGEPPLSPAWRP